MNIKKYTSEDMRFDLEDPDFKDWLGRTIGAITEATVDMTGTGILVNTSQRVSEESRFFRRQILYF